MTKCVIDTTPCIIEFITKSTFYVRKNAEERSAPSTRPI